jgi:predicted ATPase
LSASNIASAQLKSVCCNYTSKPMPFEPKKISREDVLFAAKKIEAENIRLNPSTGYDVVIDGIKYPPKEIIRISYEKATGIGPGAIYGGEQVNSVLRNLGFAIVAKSGIWKLGCNWGSGSPSFYEYIKKEKIVIGTDEYRYKVGDLIVVTQGFTVYAIAKVLAPMTPVTENTKFSTDLDEFEVDIEKWVFVASADWYELSKTEVFTYELQQGIRRIRKQEIKEKVIDIWENRNAKAELPQFYSKPLSTFKSPIFPCFTLGKDNWNDYGYQTSFELTYHRTVRDAVNIGIVKILQEDDDSTELPNDFEKLESKFCSLGQTLIFYTRLTELFPDNYRKILKSLNDCAYNLKIRAKFRKHPGFEKSLLRSSEALMILNQGKPFTQVGGESSIVMKSALDTVVSSPKFTFEFLIPEAFQPHKVDFNFEGFNNVPNRFFCIIGKNGTGKTKTLSQLAIKLANNNKAGHFEPARPTFSKVIAASFSYFDNFILPEPEDISYEFIGIRTAKGLCTKKELKNIIWSAFSNLTKDIDKRKLWTECVKKTLETNYLSFDLNELEALANKEEFIDKTEEIFSSGQKIAFHFLTRLISIIDKNSLLIFDEPETHLHPNITGRLLRVINDIMAKYDSYCILATHSPIIVQEIPSRFIRIIDRKDNVPLVYQPVIECFGENLSTISNSIFYANQEKELYKILFDQMIKEKSVGMIEREFNNKLSLNARLYLQAINSDK